MDLLGWQASTDHRDYTLMIFLIVFLINFLQAGIATAEILYIRDLKVIGSFIFAALNCACWWITALVLMDLESSRAPYLIPIVLGNALATGLIVSLWKRRIKKCQR